MGEKSKINPIIKLNVGGKSFYTKELTLLESTYFQTLINGTRKNITYVGNNSDEIFIDRSGDVFRHILQYLRTGKIFITHQNTLKKMKIEAKYYGLHELVDQIDTRSRYLSENKDTYIFTSSDKLLQEKLGAFNISTDQNKKDEKYIQAIQIFGTVEKQTKCFLHQTKENGSIIDCAHENKKLVEEPMRRAIIRKYM